VFRYKNVPAPGSLVELKHQEEQAPTWDSSWDSDIDIDDFEHGTFEPDLNVQAQAEDTEDMQARGHALHTILCLASMS